ncbi:hypothetical protein M3O75_24195 [Klebsiella pneumoniae]|nr:hypothetical protein [Klebsiella pneumoniae]VXZ91099.1 Cellulose synthase operon protein C precursor [Klebsiella pneumoniae]
MRQSLYRLELIDPNNPELIAARMRYLLRQGMPPGRKRAGTTDEAGAGLPGAEGVAQ